MALRYPRITWGWEVTTSNRDLPFDRAGVDKDAVLQLGTYLPGKPAGTDEFCAEVARAMNAADAGQTYACTYSHLTKLFTITNGVAFALEFTRNPTTNAAGLLGFDDVNYAAVASRDSASAVGSGFSTCFAWDPADPMPEESPVTANADGIAASYLQRDPRLIQNVSDGGERDTVWMSTEKLIRLRMRWLNAADRLLLENFFDWIERGRRFNYQPDKASGNALRLLLRDPGELAAVHSALARDEVDTPELVFVEALSRT